MNKIKFIPFIIIAGCIYNFSGFTSREFKSIFIEVFENKTIKYGIEEKLTKAIIDEFIADNRIKIVDKQKSDAYMNGEIIEYTRKPFSYDEHANVKDYKIEMSISITVRNKEDKLLFNKKITRWLSYPQEEDEDIQIENLCKLIAEDIVKGICESW